MNDAPEIVPLSRRRPRDVRRFLNVAYAVYQHDPCWVAPLLADLKKLFADRNPLFDHAEMALWVATRAGRDVGRIAAILDQHHNRTRNDHAAFFGFFECARDEPAAPGLFDAAAAWARQRGARRLLGPMNPTTNDECGLLVDGFDRPPVFMMPYNPPHYPGLVERAGFRKAKDLLAFHSDLAQCPLERLGRIADKARRRSPDVTLTPVRRRTLAADLAEIKAVYNAAWQDNWGFVPMTDAEIDFMAGRLRPLLVEGLVWIARAREEPVGFLLALPDYNTAIQPLRGRLLTPRLAGFLPYLLGRRCPPICRVVAMGVKERFRNRGLEAVMLVEGFKTGLGLGFREAEASWILEDNLPMRRWIEAFGGTPYKTYRLYERDLRPPAPPGGP